MEPPPDVPVITTKALQKSCVEYLKNLSDGDPLAEQTFRGELDK